MPGRALLSSLVILAFASSQSRGMDVVSWGGATPEWNKKFAVTEIRSGCNLQPVDCLKRLKLLAAQQHVTRVTMAFSGSADSIASLASGYSELSSAEPLLYGVGIDDFVRVYGQWLAADRNSAPAQLQRVIGNAQSVNRNLIFGVTIYDDELDSQVLRAIPGSVRALVNRVTLYLHRRAAGPQYAKFVDEARELFPRAAILGGVYAYDRIDYVPCSAQDAQPCTQTEELSLFDAAIRVQSELIMDGKLAGVEFYPGRFGNEAAWPGWTSDRVCHIARRSECVTQSQRLRDIALQALSKNLDGAGS